ncbi:hypothetical protein BTR14_03215 [Rhizobium rhizosphaerae]|uniref:Uncharacterized protein n=1 Tax=Xaviernesmea rhizosphaerae TaxID=1672749 RepID=A0ABX3PHH3_9HYPH|nr:hypothetical protein [Xaviernesmea rhizosphaerae]OQP87592.1 hypothetical protein BTR14_03215 [Xaviernesmea rhizosphaerae]
MNTSIQTNGEAMPSKTATGVAPTLTAGEPDPIMAAPEGHDARRARLLGRGGGVSTRSRADLIMEDVESFAKAIGNLIDVIAMASRTLQPVERDAIGEVCAVIEDRLGMLEDRMDDLRQEVRS